jgi:hypothetical protein
VSTKFVSYILDVYDYIRIIYYIWCCIWQVKIATRSNSMLSAKELDTVLSVLSDDEKSFEVIATRFVKAFSRLNQFKVACTLCILLEDNVSVGLLQLSQRLAALFVLFDLHKNEPIRHNPFLEFLLQCIEHNETKLSIEENKTSDDDATSASPTSSQPVCISLSVFAVSQVTLTCCC